MLSRDRWRELEPLLDRALDMSLAERSAWLAELRLAAPALGDELGELLDEAVRVTEPQLLRELRAIGAAGLELGAYRLERLIGHGGMGSVWLGRRCDGQFEGVAAIKLLHAIAASPAVLKRFRQEGSVLARLAHPGIAKLLDAGVSASGQPFLVLEFVDGVPIDEFVRTAQLSHAACIKLVLQVLSAVQHAHVNLVVHRDIKPSNILVTQSGEAKLLDFGIAKLLDAELAARAAVSSDALAFTPFYAAPEQVTGGLLTTATDVYALGVLLYKLLSGRHPTSEAADSPAACIRMLLEHAPPQLGLGDLDSILQKALQKESAGRYQSVAAFADDLRRFLRHEPVSARQMSLWYRGARFVQRNRLGLGASAVIALGVLGASVFSWLQMLEARTQRDRVLREQERADAQVEFQRMLLSMAGDGSFPIRPLLDVGAKIIEHQPADTHGVHPRLLLQLAAGYGDMYELDAQARLLHRAQALVLAGQEAELLPEVRCALADNLRLQGEYAPAWTELDAVTALLEKSQDPRQHAACLITRANLGVETARAQESVQAAEQALQWLDASKTKHRMLHFAARASLGMALANTDQRPRAIDVYEHAIADMDASGLDDTRQRVDMRFQLALALVEGGRRRDAHDGFREVIERSERLHPTGRLNWQFAIYYAETSLQQGDADAAVRYFDRIVTQAVADDNMYWEARGSYGLVRAHLSRGAVEPARRAARRVREILAIYPHARATDDVIPDGDTLDGMFAKHAGDVQRAYDSFIKALRANGYYERKKLKRLRPVVLYAADAALLLGKLDEALTLTRDAYEIARRDDLAAKQSALVGEALLLEGRIRSALHEPDAARAALGAAHTALSDGAGAEHASTLEAARLIAMLDRADQGRADDALR